MGWFQEKFPLQGSLSVDLCPRQVLARVVEEAKAKSGVEFLVGIETEFILLKSTDPVTPISLHDYSSARALDAGTVQNKILEEIADAITVSYISLEMYHPEAAPGQFEIGTSSFQLVSAPVTHIPDPSHRTFTAPRSCRCHHPRSRDYSQHLSQTRIESHFCSSCLHEEHRQLRTHPYIRPPPERSSPSPR